MRSILLTALANVLGFSGGIARNFQRRRDQPFEQGPALKIRTQVLFREPPGFLLFPNNNGDHAHVET
jgi:hypothetical protein